MKTLSLSEAKMKLSALIESINATEEEIIITKNGSPAAVLISADDYESWQETMAIRADKEFTTEIQSSLAAFKKKKVKLYTLEELLK
jgi:prevent-host-death family protein